MSYRLHTTNADLVSVQFGTLGTIAEELGLEVDDYTDLESVALVLNDQRNQEAMVLFGTEEEYRTLAIAILERGRNV